MFLWLLKGLLPLWVVGLVLLVILRNVLVVIFVILPISLFLLPLSVAAFYLKEIRKVYPALQSVGAEHCSLCGERLLREKFTSNLFLLPYTFKTLRHYERKHGEIGKYARKVRSAFTAFVHVFILSFSIITALRGLEKVPAEASLTEALPYFLVPFFSIQLIAWGSLACLLLWKKGSIVTRLRISS